MHRLWDWDRPASVREVVDDLQRERKIAYTTVMTVLDRLAKKHLVLRELDGRAWLYRPAHSRVELYAAAIEEILRELGDADRRAVWEQVVADTALDAAPR